MNSRLREKAIQLRIKRELSYSEIGKRISVPKSTLSYWLRDLPLSERRIIQLRRLGWKRGEAARERFRNAMRVKREEKFAKLYAEQGRLFKSMRQKRYLFYIAGLMLYVAEGNKKDRYIISFANTDPDLHRLFIKWLNVFLQIPKKEIKAQLHLYENMDIEKERKFWENVLGFKRAQFYKLQIRKVRKGGFSYSESFRHGTCQVRFDSGEKKMQIMAAARSFIDLWT